MTVIRVDFRRLRPGETELPPYRADPLLQATMVTARRRAGADPTTFAVIIGRRLARNAAITGDSILAYERGEAQPSSDVLVQALQLGGLNIEGILRAYVAGELETYGSPPAGGRSRPPPGPAGALVGTPVGTPCHRRRTVT
jgi:hypothetical protein